jgi:cell division septal protein FtsQ
MMEIDIHSMKQQLEAHGQVKSASVERQFPNVLKIAIKEHEPVLRMRVMAANEQAELRIISREGTIYKGFGYPKATLNKLPFVLPYRHPGRRDHADARYRPSRRSPGRDAAHAVEFL